MFACCNNNPVNYSDGRGFWPQRSTVIIQEGFTRDNGGALGITTGSPVKGASSNSTCKSIALSFVGVFGAIATSAGKSTQNEKEESIAIPATSKRNARAFFPTNPYNFQPDGLICKTYVDPGTGSNGGIIKWLIPNTKIAIFEWNEDYEYGSHYHTMKVEWNNTHYGPHYSPGDLVPEPWNSVYFGG